MSAPGRLLRFDSFQQRHPVLGFPLAVRQKYSDDQGGYLAATIAYYGFFSIFPLLLLLVTILGFLLRGNPGLQKQILDSALGDFPILGDQLQRNIHSLRGNGLGLAIGAIGSLWAGTGVALAVENAINHLWGVPFRRRPDALRARLRAVGLLLLLGGGTLVTTGLAGLGTAGVSLGPGLKVVVIALSVAVDFGLFWLAFRLLAARAVAWGELWVGAVAAAVLWEGLQLLGGYYVGHVVRHATSVYGLFAIVIGLLSWLYLGAHAMLLAAEANVVLSRGLWPRSFSVIVELPATEPDEKALRQRAQVEERRSDERVETTFGRDRR